jgi:hypothetical protein
MNCFCPPALLRRVLSLVALAVAGPALAQYANADLPDWREDDVPPPPAYSAKPSDLIAIEVPVSASVKIGLDPATIAINQRTGIVRYVVVMRGATAVNASYEGIRCSTGEYRIYARQTQGNPWSPNTDATWKPLRGQTGVVVAYPYQLARDGLCAGTTVRQNVDEMARELRSGNQSIYLGR